MTLRVIVSNFPPGTSAEELAAALAEHEVHVGVTLDDPGSPEKATAIIELPQHERVAADHLAERINAIEYRGRYLHAHVPLTM